MGKSNTSTKKLVTLTQFVARFSTQERAAEHVGVDASTMSRWINGETHARGLAAKRLNALGVALPKALEDLV